jgi:hypothetical protein
MALRQEWISYPHYPTPCSPQNSTDLRVVTPNRRASPAAPERIFWTHRITLGRLA